MSNYETLSIENRKLVEENKMLKSLLTHGKIGVEWGSTDCDGMYNEGYCELKSVEEFYDWIEDRVEWSDGPFGYSICDEPRTEEVTDED